MDYTTGAATLAAAGLQATDDLLKKTEGRDPTICRETRAIYRKCRRSTPMAAMSTSLSGIAGLASNTIANILSQSWPASKYGGTRVSNNRLVIVGSGRF
jgi:hypothetical protein